MKKIFGLAITMILFALLVTSNDGFAQKGNCKNQGKHNCSKFVDANGDGKCDNFVDANGDGNCDNCSGRTSCGSLVNGYGGCKGFCSKFNDANNDGKCDNFTDANNDGKCDNCSGSGFCEGKGKGMRHGNNQGCGNGCKMSGNTTKSSSFTLNQNVPNPVVGNTKISFNLKEANVVKVVISDKLGNTVKDIYEGNLSVGDHDIDINVTGLNASNYFYSVYVGGKVQTKQLIVVK